MEGLWIKKSTRNERERNKAVKLAKYVFDSILSKQTFDSFTFFQKRAPRKNTSPLR